jgi:glucose-6-phosphate isomerase
MLKPSIRSGNHSGKPFVFWCIVNDLLNDQERINGNIPVNLFLLKTIDSFSLGYLIATWEHRTFITATMLQINPFDQYGVIAGKIYTKKFLQGHET